MKANCNNKSEKKYFNWPILFIISFTSIVMGIYRDGIATLFPFLQREFDLTRTQLGMYTTSIHFVTSFTSIFTGQLIDLKGPKWGMTIGVCFVGILLLLHSIANNFIILLVLAAFAGLGMGINPPAVNKSITEWFHQKWRSTATGIWSIAFPIGGLLAASLLPVMGIYVGWRKAILFPGVLALLCTLIILIFYHDKTTNKDINKKKKYNKNIISIWKGISQLINNTELLSITIYGFFLGAVNSAISTHFTFFLYLDCNLTETIAGLGFAFVQIGSILGRPGWGFICDRFFGSNRRKGFLFIGFLFFLITLFFGIVLKNLNNSIIILFFLAFLTGCSGRGWQGLFYSSIPEIVNEEQVGGATGLSMIFNRVGMLITPPIFGYIADLRNSYDLSWLLLGVVFLLSSVSQYLFYIRIRTHNSVK